MRLGVRMMAAAGVAAAVGLAAMAQDRATDAGWAVTAEQIADARAHGKTGVETGHGLVTEPERSANAPILPLKWALVALGAGLVVLAGTGRRKPPARTSTKPPAPRRRP